MKSLLTKFLTLIFLLSRCSNGYKMVIFVPDLTNSQVIFTGRVAETLAKAGHDVTMVLITGFTDRDSSDVEIMKEVSIYRVNASFGVTREEALRKQTEMIFKYLPMWDYRMRNSMKEMSTLLLETCRRVTENKEFLDWLVNQKFDLAFPYMADSCPIGLVHYAKIPSWIWLSSAGLIDYAAHYIGAPIVPSYIPTLVMESTDEMNFYERTKSLIGHFLMVFFWKRMFADPQTEMFRRIDPSFPHIVDVAQKCPLVMVNSNELYELPRPTLAKIVNIGGIGMQLKDAQPLTREFQQIVDKSEGLVVFSFGSVAPSHLMPETWKTAFLEAFSRFPKLHFVLRYEGTDLKERLPANVHVFKWLPQADLLQHPKTKAFISHGGYNSLQEVITAGVPMIALALWGDQPRNAKLAEKLGIAINLQKNDITATTVSEALKKIISDKTYLRNVKRLSLMVKKQPVSPAHRLVAWAEFVAEFKTLDNLVPAGTKLNFIQYHSLDVIAFLSVVIILVIFTLFKILKFVLLRLYGLVFKADKLKKS